MKKPLFIMMTILLAVSTGGCAKHNMEVYGQLSETGGDMVEETNNISEEIVTGVNTYTQTVEQTVLETETMTEEPTDPPTEPQTEPPTDPPTEAPTEAPLVNPETGIVVPDYIYGLNRATRSAGYGPDVPRDKYNRPATSENLQSEYGNAYNALFIGDEQPVLYLTFVESVEYNLPDGTSKTARILDILNEYNIKAMFFCTGNYIKRNKSLCTRMLNEGHKIGGHGYAHPSGGMAEHSIYEQYQDAALMKQTVRDVLGTELYYYKPDYEKFSHQSLAILNEMGLRTVMHSFAYNDYLIDSPPEAEWALQQLEKSLHYGEIFCLHATCDTNITILKDFIEYANDKGYTFGAIE